MGILRRGRGFDISFSSFFPLTVWIIIQYTEQSHWRCVDGTEIAVGFKWNVCKKKEREGGANNNSYGVARPQTVLTFQSDTVEIISTETSRQDIPSVCYNSQLWSKSCLCKFIFAVASCCLDMMSGIFQISWGSLSYCSTHLSVSLVIYHFYSILFTFYFTFLLWNSLTRQRPA